LVEEIDESSTDESNCKKDVQKIKQPKIEIIHWICWEQHLPKKYVIASTSENLLKLDVEIETTDTSVTC
jgi:hypothetical protein